jgi:steroid 5-alpha reductase family enzyme
VARDRDQYLGHRPDGLAVFAAGFLLEALADWQLLRFKRRFPHGRILTTGCWSRTRHPNYLGESVLWWGIGLMSLTGSGGVHVFLGPILITFLLVRVSGVPLLEGKYKDNPEYQAYARRSGAFLPRLRQSS